MQLLDGTILDFRDDPKGDVLRSVFPQQSLIPDPIKLAMAPEKLDRLEDHHFALVFDNHGKHFRKFAHPDAGHTMLSTIYFLNTGYHLPEMAQKVAAKELVKAAEMYGVPVPMELRKVAFWGALVQGAKGLGSRAVQGVVGAGKALASPGSTIVNKLKENPLGIAMTGMSVAGTAGEIKNNLQSLKGPQGDLVGSVNV